MDRQYTDQTILLQNVAQNGASSPTNMASFRNAEFEISMVNFTGTLRFVGSNADKAPDFNAAATASNPWDYVRTINQTDGSSISGGTGVTGTAETSTRQVEANTNGFKWLGVVVSGYASGAITAKAKGFSNQ